jgi:hypothetical protein
LSGGLPEERVILEFFQEGKISSGKAAEILGLSKAQFLELLSQRNLPYLDAGLTDLEREVAAAESAGKPVDFREALAREGSRKDFEAVLAKVPDTEPDPWDRWAPPDPISKDR